MELARKQLGIGMLNLLYVLVTLAVFGLVGLKLLPLYLEGFKVQKAITAVAAAPGATERTPRELAYSVVKRLDIDGVTRIKERNWKEYLTIKIRGKAVSIQAEYQAVVPLFMDISLLTHFRYDATN